MLINIDIPGSPYKVNVGESVDGFGPRLKGLTKRPDVFVITNETVAGLYMERLLTSLNSAGFSAKTISLPDGEQYKSLDTIRNIYVRMSEEKLERFTPVIGFGGGVVGDISGFAASTYMRGLPFYNIPSSLIAQVDSAVGGKTGVNLPSGKNLVGTFYQPSYVHADTSLLATLDHREYISGLAEVIKHALISGEEFFQYLENNVGNINELEENAVEKIVSECVRIKGDVVVKDEKESGLRRVLNLGHTLGHSIEAVSGYGNVRHGEGVSIGMVAAARIAVHAAGCSSDYADRIEKLLAAFGLPVRIPSALKAGDIIDTMKLDKKVRERRIEFVLPVEPGKVQCGVPVEEDAVFKIVGELYEK